MARDQETYTFAERVLWFNKHWHLLALGASTIAGLVANLFDPPGTLIPVLIASGLFLAGSIRAFRVKPSYIDLYRAKAAMDSQSVSRLASFQGVFRTLLKELADEIGTTASNSRISGYSHNGKAFVMIGRVSDNPALEVSGRGLYPDDEGIISRAWQKGHSHCIDLPADEKEYAKVLLREFKMPLKTTAAITMKARSLVGVRVADNNKQQTPVGVVIVESAAPRGVGKATLDRVYKSDAWKSITAQMVASRDMLPDVLGASKEGF